MRQAPRGRCFLAGTAWGAAGSGLVLDRVREAASVDAWPSLADDERILFLLGYEASLGKVSGDASLGPDRFAWVCKVVDVDVARIPVAAARLPSFSTTEEQHQRHLARVHQCREHLLDGVIYQANLAHRLTVAARSHQEGLAHFLQQHRHAACSAFVDVDNFGSFVSLSPERFIEADLQQRIARTYPIKGTAPSSSDPSSLASSEKDRAEHVMIVDLLRNDLGRVAQAGGVTVESLMHATRTRSVHHLESTIAATLRDDVGVSDLLAACAPGGSITGAPKSSAVDVIAALEGGPRGPYTGVLGVIDGAGRMMSSLLIRTWIRPDGAAGSLHVGGGIVVDSDPEAEWQETLHKARGLGPVSVEP